MSEIVRLLRWRAEWDGAGLVDGANRAAEAGERLRKSIGEVGKTAPDALKKTSTAAKETDTSFEGLGFEAQQVLKYVQSLEKGAGSPLVLKRNAELAEAAFNVLSASAQKAGRAIPEAFSDRVITAIGRATTQAAGMNAELEKMGGQTPTKLDKVITALDRTAQSGERASRAIGSAAESTNRLAKAADATAQSKARLGDSLRKNTEGVTKFKGAALEAWGALALGKTIGEGLAKAIDKVDASMAAHDKRMSDAAVNAIKFRAAMKLAEAGLIALGGTQEQFLAGYDAYIAKTSPAARASEERARALLAEKAALDALGESMKKAGEGVSFSLKSPDEMFMPLEEAEKYAERLNEILAKAFAEGGSEERKKWAEANKETIEEVLETLRNYGQEAPTHIKAAADAMGAATSAIETLARAEAAHQAAASASQAETLNALSTYNAKMRALNELQLSEEEYSARKKQLYDEMIAATTKAAAAEESAAKQAAAAQDEVLAALEATPERFAEIERAAAAYNSEIEKGATPTAAMKTVVEELSAGLFDATGAMEKAGAASVRIVEAAQSAVQAGVGFGQMAASLGTMVSEAERAIETLARLKGGFDEVRAAAAEAGGGAGA